jgi:uracil-DNA glycosylase
MSSPAKETTTTIFLEDIDTNYGTKKPEDGELNASQSSQPGYSSSQDKPNLSNKRQRTIDDMFFGGKKGAGPSKKPKMSGTESNGTSANTRIIASAPKTSGLLKLNSIPFSSSEFIDSLDEEQKRLLQLECEIMGKSWSVSFFDFQRLWLIVFGKG